MALTDENGGMSTTMIVSQANGVGIGQPYPLYMNGGNGGGLGGGGAEVRQEVAPSFGAVDEVFEGFIEGVRIQVCQRKESQEDVFACFAGLREVRGGFEVGFEQQVGEGGAAVGRRFADLGARDQVVRGFDEGHGDSVDVERGLAVLRDEAFNGVAAGERGDDFGEFHGRGPFSQGRWSGRV